MDLPTFVKPERAAPPPPPAIDAPAPLLPEAPPAHGRPRVVAFLRHVGCPFAEVTIRRLDAASRVWSDAQFLAESQGTPAATRQGTVPDKDPMHLHAQAATRTLEDCEFKNPHLHALATEGLVCADDTFLPVPTIDALLLEHAFRRRVFNLLLLRHQKITQPHSRSSTLRDLSFAPSRRSSTTRQMWHAF